MKNGNEALNQIVEKSALDPDFRQSLISDPKAAICKELGVTLPDSMTIKIHESDMQTVHLALPPSVDLTDEQLEAVAAGLCCCGW